MNYATQIIKDQRARRSALRATLFANEWNRQIAQKKAEMENKEKSLLEQIKTAKPIIQNPNWRYD